MLFKTSLVLIETSQYYQGAAWGFKAIFPRRKLAVCFECICSKDFDRENPHKMKCYREICF